MNYNYKCVNHKDKRGKFQLENNHDASYYCDNCAVELSLKGHRLLTINQTEMTNKMAN
jgi:predicted SprT family Zn-dependent metalloprotease